VHHSGLFRPGFLFYQNRYWIRDVQRLHEKIIKEKEDKIELYERLLAEMKKQAEARM